ncbi:MAG: hypothetical protein KHZ62_01840 [Clostridiales bacterium]|nr:hypothetical protein [Clostridiales bacterium]
MAENELLQIARLIENRKLLETDISDLRNMLREKIQKNYIDKLHHAVNIQKESVENNPSREVVLLNALKQYHPHQDIDALIRTLNLLRTAQKIREEFHPANSIQSSENDASLLTLSSASNTGHTEFQAAEVLLLLTLMNKI